MGFYHRIHGLTHFFREHPSWDWNTTMKTYMCVICGFIYDEAKGLPEEGLAPGTLWKDVPLTWRCPDCGAGKEDFEMMEL
jgi:rubredoxin